VLSKERTAARIIVHTKPPNTFSEELPAMTNRNLPVQVVLILFLIQSTPSFITASPQDQQHQRQREVEQEDVDAKLDESTCFKRPQSRINEYITRG
jgi:hypothetical protein